MVTWRLKSGENLNFAVPVNPVKSLLDAQGEVIPLSKSESRPLKSPVSLVKQDRTIWTSLLTGRDYKLRFDNDYMYTGWVNLPSELQNTAAFMRSELKKTGDIWVGKTRTNIACELQGWTHPPIVKWYTYETAIQISKVSESRIEGKAENYAGFDCKKGKPLKGSPSWREFTWIPKE